MLPGGPCAGRGRRAVAQVFGGRGWERVLPAAASKVIALGAVADGAVGLALAPCSNSFASVCDPGGGVISAAAAGGLGAMSGTSMACSHVAGVAALWWEHVVTSELPATLAMVVAKLMAFADAAGFDHYVAIIDRGAGLVKAP